MTTALGAFLLLFGLASAAPAWSQPAIGVRHLSLIDPARAVRATQGFAGSATRRIDVTIWYPARGAAATGDAPIADAALDGAKRRPLLIYSHGSFGSADNAMHLVRDLVADGYIVAAPDYPLSSHAAYTHITGVELRDVANQPRDIGFVLDRLLADPVWAAAIDPARIGAYGHSLGAVTTYFASFGAQTRDPRLRAVALLGAGDPVQAALSNDMGLAGSRPTEIATPVLFVSAEDDVFARMTGLPHVAFTRVPGSKYEVTIAGGIHIWMTDNHDQRSDGRNPDCSVFIDHMPGVRIPGCAERLALTTPAQEQAVVRYAVRNFFDAWLKEDAAARRRLSMIASAFRGVTLRSAD